MRKPKVNLSVSEYAGNKRVTCVATLGRHRHEKTTLVGGGGDVATETKMACSNKAIEGVQQKRKAAVDAYLYRRRERVRLAQFDREAPLRMARMRRQVAQKRFMPQVMGVVDLACQEALQEIADRTLAAKQRLGVA